MRSTRSRSRSRSRSPHSRSHHYRDRKKRKKSSNNNDSNSQTNNDRNRLITERSASVFRSRSSVRSNSILRSISNANPTNGNDRINSSSSNKSERPKPKFTSRKMRHQLALQEMESKKVAQRTKLNEIRQERESFFRSVRDKKKRNLHSLHDHNNYNNRSHMTDRQDSDHNNKNKKNWRNNHNNSYNRKNGSKNNNNHKNHNNNVQMNPQVRNMELQLIKDQYLGKKKVKKSVVPPSQKFKFNFDWEASEDTSEDFNSFYKKKANYALRFGRGYIAGIDREEQNKKNANIWRNIQHSHGNVHNSNTTGNNKNMYDSDDLNEELLAKRMRRKEKEKLKSAKDKLDSRNWRDKKMSEMTERDWRILKEEFRISTKFGGRLPNPIRFWEESGLPPKILKAIREVARYPEPYKIQRMAIPVGLSNRDCVGIAETGSGKTAAFVLPMLVYVLSLPKMNEHNFEDGPYGLVLAPTRELASQIEGETNKFATFLDIQAVTIVGGVSHDEQSMLLRKGAEVIIATPGRLLDCIDRRILVLNQCNYVVLDEADRMIDMGFEPQVNAIFDCMPSTNLRPIDQDDMDVANAMNVHLQMESDAAADGHAKGEKPMLYRQTFMFSATMPASVERLTKKYLRNAVYITIGDPNATANEHVKQNVLWLSSDKLKRKKLLSLLPSMTPPIMIFVNMKKNVDSLAKFLRSQQYHKTISLHGGKSQEMRDYALKQFKNNSYDILVCTNVAGRGIDVENVQHVINYDMPTDIRDYCHRIGRTGRAGQQGVATSFLTKDDTDIMYDLKKMLLKTGNVCPSELMQHEAAMRNPNNKYDTKTTKQILAKVKP